MLSLLIWSALTNSIYFYKENLKQNRMSIIKYALIPQSASKVLSYQVDILLQDFPVVLKNLSPKCGNQFDYGTQRTMTVDTVWRSCMNTFV